MTHSCIDHLPKNWRKTFRKKFRGTIKNGDIIEYSSGGVAPEWCSGLIGETISALGFRTTKTATRGSQIWTPIRKKGANA